MAATEAEPRKPARRKPARRRYRRRLRSRIILSFVLLGVGLTTLFAFLTDFARQRVEDQLVEEVMNRNIDEYARRFYTDPTRAPDVPVEQIRAFFYTPDRFDRVRQERPAPSPQLPPSGAAMR